MMHTNKRVLAGIFRPLIDILIFLCSCILASFIAFNGIPDSAYFKRLLFLYAIVALARILFFRLFSIYSIAWKFFSLTDALALFKAVIPVTVAWLLGMLLFSAQVALFRLPLAIIAMESILTFCGTLGVRMADRLVYERASRRSPKKRNVLLIGSGEAGANALRELDRRKYAGIRVLGFIDDDPKELNSVIRGIRVLGNTRQISEIVKKLSIDEAISTNPDLASSDMRRLIDVCKDSQIRLKILRGSFELRLDATGMRDVPLADAEALAQEQLATFKGLTGRDYDVSAEKGYAVDNEYETNKPFSDPGGLSGDLLIAAGTMVKLLHLAAGASVLDLGCGCGWTSILLARCGFEVTGLDINEASLEIARRNAEIIGAPVKFINADMQNFSVERPFEAIVIFDSLHHCLRERAVLLRAESALRPGGKIILCEPTFPEETRAGILTNEPAIQAMSKHGTLEKGMGMRYLIRLLFDCGFEMVTVFVSQSHYRTWLVARKSRAGAKAVRSVMYTSDFEEALL